MREPSITTIGEVLQHQAARDLLDEDLVLQLRPSESWESL